VRQPLRVGGNDFSRDSIAIAGSGTQEFITCLRWEDKCTILRPAVCWPSKVQRSPSNQRVRMSWPSLDFRGAALLWGRPAQTTAQYYLHAVGGIP
jgi:hypothetical protein